MDHSGLAAVKKIVLQKIGAVLVVSAALYLFAGCGEKNPESIESAEPPETTQEVSVQYHADDEWSYDADILNGADAGTEPDESVKNAEEKTVITVSVGILHSSCGDLLDRAAVSFNKENEQYYVELIGAEPGDDLISTRLRLQTEVGAGRGPDIMTTDVFSVNQEMLDRGMLVDLTPYLQASGITEEKFFPGYACLRSGEKIYGISPTLSVEEVTIDAKVLGGAEAPDDIETLVDMLLEYPERASFFNTVHGGYLIMNYFLGGSEDLWGMIDWEDRSCDFSGELFSKMLETAKRYLQDGKSGCEPVMGSVYTDVGGYESREVLESRGLAVIDYCFDDGYFPKATNNTSILFINANTEHLDGAWAFLSYLMSKKGQNTIYNPVHRELFDEKIQSDLKLIDEGRLFPTNPFTKEIAEEMIGVNNRARQFPVQTEVILDIIYEETESYFSGDKSKEEVIDIIQNRVQMYLNEG